MNRRCGGENSGGSKEKLFMSYIVQINKTSLLKQSNGIHN